MEKSKSSYRHIVKATSIFGGVQVFQILTTLIKAKFASVLIGAAGMGMLAIFTSTLLMINAISNYGLIFGATREISKSAHANDLDKLNRIYSAITKLVIIFSLFGAVLMIIFSKYLSNFAFGNSSYFSGFIFLSVTILFSGITNINNSVLQGMKRLKDLANSTMIGSGLGLISSIPLYYFFGKAGIVPSIIITSACSFIISYYFIKKTAIQKIKMNIGSAFIEGKGILNLAIIMFVAYVFGSFVIYIINIFIVKFGSVSELGLYSAGISFSSQFVSLVFVSMSIDFFPRLSAISADNHKVTKMVNEQAEITYLILLPILVIMILVSPLVVKLFLTSEFNQIINFIRITALSIVFQAAAYIIANIPIAKGHNKLFISFNSIIPGVSALIFCLMGYHYFGLNGIAIGSCMVSFIHFTSMALICYKMYGFKMDLNFLFIFFITLISTVTTFFVVIYLPGKIAYALGGIIFLFTVYFSILKLDKLLNIRELLSRYSVRR